MRKRQAKKIIRRISEGKHLRWKTQTLYTAGTLLFGREAHGALAFVLWVGTAKSKIDNMATAIRKMADSMRQMIDTMRTFNNQTDEELAS